MLTDPNSTYHPDADPDSDFLFYADPDPNADPDFYLCGSGSEFSP